MKCALFLYCVTPHLKPLCDELQSRMGCNNCMVIYLNEIDATRVQIGWSPNDARKCLKYSDNSRLAKEVVENADILICEVRDAALFKLRSRKGLKTFYTSERWFKPQLGIARMLHPKFLAMSITIGRLLNNDSNFFYLPVGIHAAEDMFRLVKIVSGNLSFLFKRPKLTFDPRPGGEVDGTKKMLMWAYYIQPSKKIADHRPQSIGERKVWKILWVGRLLKLKRIEDIIKAVQRLNRDGGVKFLLDIFGEGPDVGRLMKLVEASAEISLNPPVSNVKVRELMSEHDIYILSSDCHEGWGAVVGEALEEHMLVFGTRDAGASATQLPETHLYNAGDVDGLCQLLLSSQFLKSSGIGPWTPSVAADWLIKAMNKSA